MKELIKAGKKQQAKQKIAELEMIKKNLTSLSNQKMVLTKMKMNTQSTTTTADMHNIMKDNIRLQQVQAEKQEEMQDLIFEQKELEQKQQEMNQMWEDLANEGLDQDNIDDQLKEFEKEINLEKAAELDQQLQGVGQVNVAEKQPAQQLAQPQKNKNDDFSNSLFAALN